MSGYLLVPFVIGTAVAGYFTRTVELVVKDDPDALAKELLAKRVAASRARAAKKVANKNRDAATTSAALSGQNHNPAARVASRLVPGVEGSTGVDGT